MLVAATLRNAYLGFSNCIPFNVCAIGQRADQAGLRPLQRVGWSALRMQGAPSAGRRREKQILACSGRIPPIASPVSQRSYDGFGHADTVTAGAPRSPSIRPSMPSKTTRGSAASAI